MSVYNPYQCMECHTGIHKGVPGEDEPQFCNDTCMNKFISKNGRMPCGIIRNEVSGGSFEIGPSVLLIIAIAIIIKSSF